MKHQAGQELGFQLGGGGLIGKERSSGGQHGCGVSASWFHLMALRQKNPNSSE